MKKANSYLKLVLTVFLFIGSLNAQPFKISNKDTVIKGCGLCGVTSRISMGGGVDIRSTFFDNTQNSKHLNIDYFHAFKTKPSYSWGINTSLGYFTGKSSPFGNTLPEPIKVYGQITNTITSSSSYQSFGFYTGIGMQFNFALQEKIVFSPILNLNYINNSQSDFKATQIVELAGPIGSIFKSYDLLIKSETKVKGFGVCPKFRFTYMFSNKIGMWAEASYLIGPSIKNSIITFQPNSTPDSSGAYTVQNMDLGTYKTEMNQNRFKSIGLKIGVVYNFGKNPDLIPSKKPNGMDLYIDQYPKIEEYIFPPEIQKIINAQDNLPLKTFEPINSNQTTQSLCNFSIDSVNIQCDGKDTEGNKKYKVTITYKNLASIGSASLGHYPTPCVNTLTNGSYLEPNPLGSASITNLFPTTTVKTYINGGATQSISFDFVPNSGFQSLIVKGNLINSATDCGNCDNIISLILPNCCVPCDLNPVEAMNNSVSTIDANKGTISITNTISSPNMITRIEADLVCVKIVSTNNTCNKCNDLVKQQNNFVDINKIVNIAGWANNGQSLTKPDYPSDGRRSLIFNSNSPNGVNIQSGLKINHTIGIAPTSCCGDYVEVWIRYSVWDKDCKVCDKLVKSTISRPRVCNTQDAGGNGNSNNN